LFIDACILQCQILCQFIHLSSIPSSPLSVSSLTASTLFSHTHTHTHTHTLALSLSVYFSIVLLFQTSSLGTTKHHLFFVCLLFLACGNIPLPLSPPPPQVPECVSGAG